MLSIAAVRGAFETQFRKTRPARTRVVDWVENFNSIGMAETMIGHWSPTFGANGRNSQVVNYYLHWHQNNTYGNPCRILNSLLDNRDLPAQARSNASVEDGKCTYIICNNENMFNG